MITEQILRLAVNISTRSAIIDTTTNNEYRIWRGNDTRVELGIFNAAGVEDISNLASITFEVDISQNTDQAPLMKKTVLAEDFGALVQGTWDDGSAEHVGIDFTASEANIDLSGEKERKTWMVIHAVTDAGKIVTLGYGDLIIVEDNAGNVGDPPDNDPVYLTQDQVNALIASRVGLYLGTFNTLGDLQIDHPSSQAGAYAFVDDSGSDDVALYIWDDDGQSWEPSATTPETPVSIKTKYESNADTNAFTDAEKAAVGNLPADTVSELAFTIYPVTESQRLAGTRGDGTTPLEAGDVVKVTDDGNAIKQYLGDVGRYSPALLDEITCDSGGTFTGGGAGHPITGLTFSKMTGLADGDYIDGFELFQYGLEALSDYPVWKAAGKEIFLFVGGSLNNGKWVIVDSVWAATPQFLTTEDAADQPPSAATWSAVNEGDTLPVFSETENPFASDDNWFVILEPEA